jgi:hypothetical protein
MKESAPPLPSLGHNIREGSWRFGSGSEVSNVNAVLAAGFEHSFSQRIIANEAGSKEREWRAGFGKINQDVEGRSAGAHGLAADSAQLLRLRVDVDHFYVIDHPVAPGQQTAPTVRASAFHGADGASSEREPMTFWQAILR